MTGVGEGDGEGDGDEDDDPPPPGGSVQLHESAGFGPEQVSVPQPSDVRHAAEVPP